MKYIAFLLLIAPLLTSNCIVHKSNVKSKLTGKYVCDASFNDVSESIEIFSDSTFLFKWNQGLISGETHGRWSVSNSGIKLYSEYAPDSHNFNLIIPPQKDQNYYELLVRNMYSENLIAANCIAYEKGKIIDGSSTNELGICKLPIDKTDSIAILYVGHKDAGFPTIRSISPKSLIIELVEYENYHYFMGENVIVINEKEMKIETFDRNKIFIKR